MVFLAYPEDSLQILQEGERLSKELGDERSLANIYSSIGMYYSLRGESLLGRKYAQYCFEEAEKIQDIELMAPIGFDLSVSYNGAGEFFKVAELAPRVLALLESTQRESESFGKGINLYSALLSNYGGAMGMLGNFEEGEALCEKGLRFALDIDNLYNIGWAELTYSAFFAAKGDGKNAVDHSLNSVRYFEELQLVLGIGLALTELGLGYYFLGDLETAREHVQKAIDIQSSAGIPFYSSLPYWILGVVDLDSGDLENALGCTEEALELAKKNNEKLTEGTSRILLGRVLGKADKSRYSEAEECILQGIKLLDELKLKPFFSQGYFCLGELYSDIGQEEKALENLKKAEGLFQEMGMDYWLRKTQAVLERVKG
jgi:tetratricopeptide (TPR) repeat protein